MKKVTLHHNLEYAATHSHPFDIKIKNTIWPVFYSTAFFLPKFKLKITNKGEAIPKGQIQVDVSQYDGPIGNAMVQTEGWVDAFHETWLEPWQAGKLKKLTVKIKGRNLPKPGTYIVRFSVNRWNPQGAPYKDTKEAISKMQGFTEASKKDALEASLLIMKELGMDPYKPTGSFTGEKIFTGTIIDYFRIEPVSNVMNFWLVVGTVLVALATLILGIITIIKP